MPQGMRAWNADGLLIMDTSISSPRIVAYIETGGNGSTPFSYPNAGRIWFCPMRMYGGCYVPVVWLQDGNINWQYSVSSNRAVVRIMVGMY